MTPNEIEVLLHCHTSPSQHPRFDAPAVSRALHSLTINSLIRIREDGFYETTDRGRAHVEQLCTTSWPVQRWANSRGELIAMDGDC